MNAQSDVKLVALSAEIAASFVGHNSVSAAELPDLIRTIHGALAAAAQGRAEPAAAEERKPAVPVKKSVTPDYIICLEDGRRFKSLRRHLRTRYNMTPEQYRERWSLPYDYPMVAPNYAETRSALAKGMGLGRPRLNATAE
ncbi:MAG: MucR family transcriptional regulator [Methylobacteriaceae bacterium]|nr:MucR family transcriptional regulator [Methylobacteriaceae bacterium]